LTIRKANVGDAKRLAAIAEETFRDTFAAVNTAKDMELHCRTNYSEARQAEEIVDPNMVTLLCEQDGNLQGFAQLRWGDPPDCVVADAPGEIHRLYVVRDGHGRGVAHEIMTACLDEVGRHGSDVVWLGVWERNPRAIAFYMKFEFREVGEHIFPVGNDPQRDIVLARPVAHASSSCG
jgi:diamine N-acetyltransferase